MSTATKNHLEAAAGHLKAARGSHAEVRVSHDILSDLATRARTAASAGDHPKAKKLLDKLSDEVTTARSNHASTADHHRALGHSLDAATRSIDPATEEVANPTAAMGAQGSDGQTQGKSGPPRSFDPEIRRQQDQLRSCELAYETRQEQLRGLRR